MSKRLVIAGALVGVAAIGWLGTAQKADAGWGPPFACGAGAKTQTVKWDQGIETPGVPEAAITGVTATKPVAEEEEWTAEELKAGKPLFLYYYVDGLDATNGTKDENYKFSQSFEFGGLAEKVVTELNDNWRCKKVGIPLDADRKVAKNQTRIEFWSFTGTKIGDITLKETGLLGPSPLNAKLRQMRAKNSDLCAKEIKRLDAARKAREKAEKDAAAKETAAK